jgi:hypothetical protein
MHLRTIEKGNLLNGCHAAGSAAAGFAKSARSTWQHIAALSAADDKGRTTIQRMNRKCSNAKVCPYLRRNRDSTLWRLRAQVATSLRQRAT